MQRYGEPSHTARGDDTDLAARWTVRLMAVAVFVVVVAVALRLTVSSLDKPDRSVSSMSDRGGAQAGGAATVEDLGPLPGVDVATYIQNRRAALTGVAAERVSVVSLSTYATEAQARSIVGSLAVVALLVAPPEAAPSTVVGSLTAWANGQTTALRDERDEIRKLLPTVTDPAFTDFYTAEIDRLDQAAKAVSPLAPVVFAVAVKGPAAALQALGGRSGIRLVDVGEGSQAGAKATYRGLRPEEQVKANDPSTRPA